MTAPSCAQSALCCTFSGMFTFAERAFEMEYNAKSTCLWCFNAKYMLYEMLCKKLNGEQIPQCHLEQSHGLSAWIVWICKTVMYWQGLMTLGLQQDIYIHTHAGLFIVVRTLVDHIAYPLSQPNSCHVLNPILTTSLSSSVNPRRDLWGSGSSQCRSALTMIYIYIFLNPHKHRNTCMRRHVYRITKYK